MRRQREYTISQPWNYYYSLTISISLMFCSWAINRHSCLYMKVSKKDKALFDARIFLPYSSLIRSDFGKSSRALRFPSYHSEFLFFFSLFSPSRRTTMWIIMNTGGAFNDRSIHTMNASFVFSFIIIWQCETTVLFRFSPSLCNSSLVESCRIWETLHRLRREAARYREIVRGSPKIRANIQF